MYYSVTTSMKDLFSPIRASPLSVILQCFIIYVIWVLYSWLLRCDCCQKMANVLLLYKWTVYRHNKTVLPQMCFLLLTIMCKSCFIFCIFSFLNLSWSSEKNNRINVTILSCLSMYFFLIWLILKTFWFLKCSSVASCGLFFSFSSVCFFNTWGYHDDWGAWLNTSTSHWFFMIWFVD